MKTDPPRHMVLSYDQEDQRMNVQLLDPATLAPLLVRAFKVPILLGDFDFKLNDEFARRLGVAILNAIALGQPELNQYLTVTQHPIEGPHR